MKIGIIIVNYNKKELLEKCLVSLEKITYDNYQAFVVDNGSSDNSIKLLKERFPRVQFIELGYNSGFCKANNVGIRACLENDCNAVVLLNNDTEVDPNFLQEMVSVVNIPEKFGMVAAKILFLKRKEIIDSAGLEITPDGLAKNRGLENKSSKFCKKEEVFCPAGAAALYSAELLRDIEYNGQFLDEDFQFYFEELDLGWRARLLGWKCIYTPEAKVYHLKSATSGAYSEFIAFYTNRNIFYNLIKNYPTGLFLRAIGYSFLRYLFLGLGLFFKAGAASKIKNNVGFLKLLKVTFYGWKDLYLNYGTMKQKRNFIQSRKKVSNCHVNEWFKKFGVSFIGSLYK